MTQMPTRRLHFVPEFYLKRWMPRGSQPLTQYSKPFGDKVVPKRVYPKQTGFVDRDRDLSVIHPAVAAAAEDQFYRPVDDKAAIVLQKMEAGNLLYSAEEKTAWARFVLAFKHRVPEEFIAAHALLLKRLQVVVAQDERRYARVRGAGDPASYAEFVARQRDTGMLDWIAFKTLIEGTERAKLNEKIINMEWGTYSFGWNVPALLTSDRPLISGGSILDGSFSLMIPVGPKRLFIAAQSRRALDEMMLLDPWQLRNHAVETVVSRASLFVYGFSDAELRFVQAHMGVQRDPLTMADKIEADATARLRSEIGGRRRRR